MSLRILVYHLVTGTWASPTPSPGYKSRCDRACLTSVPALSLRNLGEALCDH